ncbi:hypothetical protein L195_g019245 [Trifolium pratense]|uniref:Uncharacterized protein n=1 Tax=Trifolium pratense TaxID=57577 RepID=A0A2K3MZ57_TRIPR|nr:hypothetical protein L195_g019245 [Trifolium pratense]
MSVFEKIGVYPPLRLYCGKGKVCGSKSLNKAFRLSLRWMSRSGWRRKNMVDAGGGEESKKDDPKIKAAEFRYVREILIPFIHKRKVKKLETPNAD